MALLDLQDMEITRPTGAPAGGSSHSANSCTASTLSVGLCGDHSVLSLILC